MSGREPPRSRRRRGREHEDLIGEDGALPEELPLLGVVAVVGYPNVGKSTLCNRLAGRRDAVVHEQPGVTRDRKDVDVEWSGRRFRLVDTGGIDLGGETMLASEVAEQTRTALAEADLALFVVDVKAGVMPGDLEVAEILRRQRIPVVLVANKAEGAGGDAAALQFHALGLGDPLPVSGIHGTGSGDLLDVVVERLEALPDAARVERVADEIGVAILGRPNVGKSSLFNALIGQPRVIVSDMPGTTRDAIDTRLERDATAFRLIDTAGMRRKRHLRQDVEYWSEKRALAAAERADVALVLIDGSEGLVDHDLDVADAARKAGCATLVVVSKWDASDVDLDDLRGRLEKKLRQRPEIVTTSSVTGRGLERLLERIVELYGRYSSRLPTPQVNRALQDAVEARQPPLVHGRRLKILYGAQVQTRPPRFRVTINDRRLITRDYAYYLENRLREAAGLQGCPVVLDLVAR
jgi:GTP-binding protein